MKQSVEVVVSMGSNASDGSQKLQTARLWLNTVLTGISDSGIYTTKAYHSQGNYFNIVVRGYTTLSAIEFEIWAKKREQEAGRIKPSEEVALDIDLVLIGDNVVRPDELQRQYFQTGYAKILKKTHTAIT